MRSFALLVLVGVAACDPIWSVHTTLRDPANQPIEGATLAVACDGQPAERAIGMSVRSDRDGIAHVSGLGNLFPVGCDVFVAKPGYRTQRIRYRDLCPTEPGDCERVVGLDLVLEPEL